ncbi:MAG TPA: glycosyltransferase [Bryobacteraceae bacterium]|nr:glycosyltransferase [Bryobacteraceae bacterium]
MHDRDATPTVTVVICVHNGEKFLADTLDSALTQSYRAFEIVVVDDGSADGSHAVLDRYSDPRLRVIRQDNRGAASALTAGIEAAVGELIAPLDQDDIWETDSLASHVASMQRRPEVALSFSWFRVIDEAGRPMGIRSSRYRGTIDFPELLRDFVIGATSNVVIRRSAIDLAGGVDASLPRLYDLDLFLRIALLQPGNVLAIERDLMRYRRHPGQNSRNLEAVKLEWSRTLEKLRGLAPRAVAQVEEQARSNMSRYFARLAFEDAKYADGLSLLFEGFRFAPAPFITDPRNWLTAIACLSGMLLHPRLHRRLEKLAGLRLS